MNGHMRLLTPLFSFLILTAVGVMSCTAVAATESDSSPPLLPTAAQVETVSVDICPVTSPEWLLPPEDSAVQNPPAYGHYFANEDRSILASAWWAQQDEYHARAGEDGIKVGWFRPAGEPLEITGQRVDAKAPPLETSIPCCYPTQFQATGLIFPTEGCWEVTATAADSKLSFVVWIEP